MSNDTGKKPEKEKPSPFQPLPTDNQKRSQESFTYRPEPKSVPSDDKGKKGK